MGGVARRADLYASARQLRGAVEAGVLLRPRVGWYASVGLPGSVIQAVRVGGVLTGPSVLALAGCWQSDELVHVRVPANAARLRWQPNVCLHYQDGGVLPHDSLRAAALETLRCAPAAHALSVLESAAHHRLFSAADWDWIAAHCTNRMSRTLRHLSELSESGLESLVAHFLRSHHIRFAAQVVIGRARVDFLIGERLVLEIDGFAFHGTRADQHRDKLRDLELTRRGYRVIRLSWEMVMLDWAHTSAQLLEILRGGAHRAPRTRSVVQEKAIRTWIIQT